MGPRDRFPTVPIHPTRASSFIRLFDYTTRSFLDAQRFESSRLKKLARSPAAMKFDYSFIYLFFLSGLPSELIGFPGRSVGVFILRCNGD